MKHYLIYSHSCSQGYSDGHTSHTLVAQPPTVKDWMMELCFKSRDDKVIFAGEIDPNGLRETHNDEDDYERDSIACQTFSLWCHNNDIFTVTPADERYKLNKDAKEYSKHFSIGLECFFYQLHYPLSELPHHEYVDFMSSILPLALEHNPFTPSKGDGGYGKECAKEYKDYVTKVLKSFLIQRTQTEEDLDILL